MQVPTPQLCPSTAQRQGVRKLGGLGWVCLGPEVQEAGLMVQVTAHGHNLIRGIWQE